MAAPLKYQQTINKIKNHDSDRVTEAIKTFERLNLEVPDIILTLIEFAKTGKGVSSHQFQAMKTIIQYHEELADKLLKAADKLEEDNNPKEQGNSGNVVPHTASFNRKATQ